MKNGSFAMVYIVILFVTVIFMLPDIAVAHCDTLDDPLW